MADVKLPNLDQLAAKTAQAIVEQAIEKLKSVSGKDRPNPADAVDNLVTKALGILQENGVYAGMLFLFSRTSQNDQTVSQVVRDQLCEELQELPFQLQCPEEGEAKPVLEFFANQVCNDMDTLFMVKELYEQTLIYTRYGAKAAQVDTEEKSDE
ncbi:MAG: hypothetical protein ACE5JP_00805 [Candidatus Bipolaricaulia bacterium]